MIQEENLFEIGKILKPHGVKGEVTVLFNNADYADSGTDFYFLFLDGMYVPFFVEEFAFNSEVTARIKFRGIDSIEEGTTYSNVQVFTPREHLEVSTQDELYDSEWEQLIGYTVFDEDLFKVGIIREIDSSTLNTLFVIFKNDVEVLVPATTDFIVNIDSKKKHLYLNLPEGLLDDTSL